MCLIHLVLFISMNIAISDYAEILTYANYLEDANEESTDAEEDYGFNEITRADDSYAVNEQTDVKHTDNGEDFEHVAEPGDENTYAHTGIRSTSVRSWPPVKEDDEKLTTVKRKDSYVLSIVSGVPVVRGQIPYAVAIKENYRTGGWKHLCGGSIISHLRVLTAAHCFEENNLYLAKNPQKLSIVAGNVEGSQRQGTQYRGVKEVQIHPNFKFPQHDLALVLVNKPWIFNSDVAAIRMASPGSDIYGTEDGTVCEISGWGETTQARDKRSSSSELRSARIRIYPINDCSQLWGVDMRRFICSSTTIGGSDVSFGDSGGPLVCWSSRLPPALFGVTSGKNFDKSTLYTRVSAYSDWVSGAFEPKSDSCKICPLFVSILVVTLCIFI